MGTFDRGDELRELMRERILVLDGATGTMLQSRDLTAEDFGGEELDGCNEHLVVTRPDVIEQVHRAYLAAGADIIETDTFGGTSVVLAEYGLGDRARELNRVAATIARRAVAGLADHRRPRFVAGSIGPTTRAITVTGGITFDELVKTYHEQACGLLEGGVDLFLVETCQDTRNAKAAVIGVQRACREHGVTRPLAVSGTIEPTGTMLAGQGADAFVASLEHLDLLAIGLNCATGPELMADHLRTMHEVAHCAVSCYPNAGLPDEDGAYGETPRRLAAALERFVDNGWVNLVGGCCGTTEQHIAAIAAMVDGKTPRQVPEGRPTRVVFSGIELVEVTPDNRPLLVGERTNVIGSRKFRNLIADGQWEAAAEIARLQIKGGAQIVDVCLQTTDGDELEHMRRLYERLIRKVKAPLMIDTTDPRAVELALTYSQGKAIVNSVNLEDGEQRFAEVAPLVRRFGAAVVVGTIDEDPVEAQAFTRQRKLEVARRSVELLRGRYGVAERDIIIDPLVFPVASGDEAYIGGAVETIEGLRLIGAELPACSTLLGISNVSFGLPPAAREVVNSVFLYHCTRAGLDLAIVNTQRLERFASIPEAERQMAEDLLLNRAPAEVAVDHAQRELLTGAPDDWREQTLEQRVAINQHNIGRVADHFRGRKRQTRHRIDLPLDERLAGNIVEGSQDGLVEDLRTKLDQGSAPLEIVNGPLMAGMNEVGRLFNANQLIVAEVLQSAEAMKAAVSFLEGFMEASQSSVRGSVVLATVKGDVHDIGKNLVEIILANNGYQVINLGIKVPPAAIIAAAREHRPDAIGLSGLLVKSALQMVVTAEDLRAAGVDTPILVGGAALSRGFTERRIAPVYGGPVHYCADAMRGLETMHRLVGTGAHVVEARTGRASRPLPRRTTRAVPSSGRRSSKVRADLPPQAPPYGDRRVLARLGHLRSLWTYVNPQMLYGKHLGLGGSFAAKLTDRDPKALALREMIEGLQNEAEEWMRVALVWRFYEASTDGDAVILYEVGGAEPAARFVFPRQPTQDGLCLADYVLPGSAGRRDSVAAFVVSAGAGVRERAEAAKAAGEYLRSYAIQALALETAEAAAEWLHRRLREDWGFPDEPALTMKQRFRAAYRGKRYSFGYPACPDLDDQAALWRLLRPEEIGVELTDGMMMDPEASVSALVFHHPDARYFSATGRT